ncbi:hypothetical protein ACVW0Y_001130 [Pseudomonas sp. TE3786]
MFRDFDTCIAWTDAMKEGHNYVGLIEYQPKRMGAEVRVLWVIVPGCVCENEAETAADNMLREIADITQLDRVTYSDGVML